MVEHVVATTRSGTLQRGGHDYRKVYAAYKAATEHTGQPTVILAKTIKGWTLGSHFEGRNATHQMKKLTLEDLKRFRDRLGIPITGRGARGDPYLPPYYHPGRGQPTIARYLHERRQALGGFLPERRTTAKPLALPGDAVYDVVKRGSGKQEVATTMAFVRLLKDLMRDKEIGGAVRADHPGRGAHVRHGLVLPDAEDLQPARASSYTSVDRELLLAYKESDDRARSCTRASTRPARSASFTAAGTSYATHGEPMIPVYIFYSMFGFQRTGDALLGGGRPDGARLRARRHRGPHHAHRRGPAARGRPLAAARRDQPGGRRLRPGVRLRDRAHRARTGCAGCTASSPRTSSTT